jgi:hypothetical protein
MDRKNIQLLEDRFHGNLWQALGKTFWTARSLSGECHLFLISGRISIKKLKQLSEDTAVLS